MNRVIGGTTVAVLAGLSLLTAMIVARGTNGDTRGDRNRAATGNAKRTPVLVELFTSEGCSSCPSADQVLARLQKDQPIDNAEIIPLSEHVDYWNYIGWADPFSSAAYSDRQRGYGTAFRLESIYTPQMVVNGQAEFVGSDRGRAESVIARAASAAHADVEIKAAPSRGSAPEVQIRVDNLPPVRRGDTADVLLAITEDNLRSNVARGENSGRRLEHTAVVRNLRVIGTVSPGRPFAATAGAVIASAWKRGDLTAVVFVQERASRRVLGAASIPLAGANGN